MFLVGKLLKDLIKNLGKDGNVFTLKASVEECIRRDSLRDNSHGEIATRVVFKKVDEFDYGIIVETEGKEVGKVVNEILKKH